jgi:hypothetical protein
MERERTREKLVCADEIAPVVPSHPGGGVGRAAAVGPLREPGFLNEALLRRLREAARGHGFDAFGVARADEIEHGRERLEALTAQLGGMFGAITAERQKQREAVVGIDLEGPSLRVA